MFVVFAILAVGALAAGWMGYWGYFMVWRESFAERKDLVTIRCGNLLLWCAVATLVIVVGLGVVMLIRGGRR